MLLCGNDCYVDSQSRASIKSAFDADVVCGYDTMVRRQRLDLWRSHEQEYMLDYTFQKLGIDTDRVEHPLLLTETLCNPEYGRS